MLYLEVNPMNKYLNLYHAFYTVANTGNVSKASKLLYISQPAISKSISRLEEELNVSLFVRNPRGVVLTEEGKILYSHIHSAFESIKAGEELINQMSSGDISYLHIGTNIPLSRLILLPRLKSFLQKYPRIKIRISIGTTSNLTSMLNSEELDVGLIVHPSPLQTVNFISFGSIHYAFITTPQYLKSLNISNPNDHTFEKILRKSTLFLLDSKTVTRAYIDNYMESNHLTADYITSISSVELLMDLVRQDIGIIAIFKEYVSNELSDGKLIELKPDLPIGETEVGIIYPKNRKQNYSIQAFLNHYKSTKIFDPHINK